MPTLTLGRRATKGVPYGSALMTAYLNATGANTTETDLAAFTLAPNYLGIGEGFRLTLWAQTAANANNKRLRVYLGTTTLFDTTALAANNEAWAFDLMLLRTGAAAQSWRSYGFRGATVVAAGTNVGTENMDLARQVRVTGQNGTAAANDLVLRGAVLERIG